MAQRMPGMSGMSAMASGLSGLHQECCQDKPSLTPFVHCEPLDAMLP